MCATVDGTRGRFRTDSHGRLSLFGLAEHCIVASTGSANGSIWPRGVGPFDGVRPRRLWALHGSIALFFFFPFFRWPCLFGSGRLAQDLAGARRKDAACARRTECRCQRLGCLGERKDSRRSASLDRLKSGRSDAVGQSKTPTEPNISGLLDEAPGWEVDQSTMRCRLAIRSHRRLHISGIFLFYDHISLYSNNQKKGHAKAKRVYFTRHQTNKVGPTFGADRPAPSPHPNPRLRRPGDWDAPF